MGERSAIEWTNDTWNPWRGCDKVSPGCAHCYMFEGQRRYGRDPSIVVRASPATFRAPLMKLKGPLVFTCSWSDFFHETADPWRDEAWDIICRTPHLTYQVLTKRPERILEHLPGDWGDGWPNVWLGTSIENRRFVHRADLLRETPATVRFVSAEPLLGPLVYRGGAFFARGADGYYHVDWGDGYIGDSLSLRNIDWLIVGGESGPKHRRLNATWVRDLRDAAIENDTAFFYKQGGGPRPGMHRVLDGRTWDEMPVAVTA